MIITRRHVLITTGGLVAMGAVGAAAQENESTAEATPNHRSGHMQITRSGSQPSNKGSADYFTGSVRVDPLFKAPDPARVTGASVTFEPGARTA
jgi:hypothetical protein